MTRQSRRKHAALLMPYGRTTARRFARSSEGSPALEAIWEVVARIPRGAIATYGDVARAAGLPGCARQVGYALRHTPAGLDLPWHRVVGAGGKIVFPQGSAAFREQARRLRGDGVQVKDGRIPPAALRTARLPGD